MKIRQYLLRYYIFETSFQLKQFFLVHQNRSGTDIKTIASNKYKNRIDSAFNKNRCQRHLGEVWVWVVVTGFCPNLVLGGQQIIWVLPPSSPIVLIRIK